MGSDLNITRDLQDYILNHGHSLHPVQKEIINYNTSLGDIKKMQIAISQCQFLHLIIKISNIKNVLEIGTFTGLSTLSMALALTENGKITTLDKNKETTKIAEISNCPVVISGGVSKMNDITKCKKFCRCNLLISTRSRKADCRKTKKQRNGRNG